MTIQRCLALTLNYDHPQNGQMAALRALVPDVVEIDYLNMPANEANAKVLEAAHHFRPDWIWAQLQETNVVSADTLREAKRICPTARVTHWTGDCRQEVSPYLSSICEATDTTLISSVGQLPMFRAAGAKDARYMQIGVDWEEDVLGLPEWIPPFKVPEVVFCGGFYGDKFPGTKDRLDCIRALQDDGIDVGVVGPGWPGDINMVGQCTVKQQHHVYRRAKVVLSINHFNDIENYYSDRHLIAMASGTPVVAKSIPGLWEDFDVVQELAPFVVAEDPVVMVKEVERLLKKDPWLRSSMGRRARQEIMKNHTWFARFSKLISEIE